MPLGNMASLELPDGTFVGDSKVIGRYLANEFGIAGNSKFEKVVADMIVAKVGDLQNQMHPATMAHFEKKETEKAEQWKRFKDNHLTTTLKIFNEELAKNKNGVFVGDQITWADLCVAEYLDSLCTYFQADLLSDQEFAALKEFVQKVHQLENIRKYVENRKPTKF